MATVGLSQVVMAEVSTTALSSNTIRVLDPLLPATASDEPICCEPRIVPLADPGHFEALSYVWGDHSSTTAVQVDGDPVTTTETLARLGRFQARSFTRVGRGQPGSTSYASTRRAPRRNGHRCP